MNKTKRVRLEVESDGVGVELEADKKARGRKSERRKGSEQEGGREGEGEGPQQLLASFPGCVHVLKRLLSRDSATAVFELASSLYNVASLMGYCDRFVLPCFSILRDGQTVTQGTWFQMASHALHRAIGAAFHCHPDHACGDESDKAVPEHGFCVVLGVGWGGAGWVWKPAGAPVSGTRSLLLGGPQPRWCETKTPRTILSPTSLSLQQQAEQL
ncbi:hypothetical protein JZ751_016473 [Albula glossodonta]|uniref:Uncharacterized protein n=1 Tax=Albula glossodonta TaxID=121402 RepID=A0A8T2NTP2_9TELE|nr:hypothetical protein JZ751_016473 [Albula glossodonta]